MGFLIGDLNWFAPASGRTNQGIIRFIILSICVYFFLSTFFSLKSMNGKLIGIKAQSTAPKDIMRNGEMRFPSSTCFLFS